ncbi:predicted protein [Uncinocarpus reesii 1704]|uniref:Ell binding protein Ebp1 C-terminal domain-containing protein n=1 Tax=Uncinocarpus reesii (strain UAMH 1704) TaxID=336963 RepID=C4JPL3_UNCRE|nr:uncharacterized protein UREG_03185 [Uncinocarpus reesii 1704]EEP78339.1 predicted protein [Uncinocarpus reesii 1704]
MSLDHATPRPDSNKAAPKSAAPSKKRSHSEYLRDTNSRFKRLTEDVFPHHPYLLTAPSDKPFRLGSRSVTNWAVGKGCLFAPEEEQLQYMTFLSRQTEDTLLVAVGGWSDRNGNIIEEDEPSRTGLKMSSNPPQKGQQKKKISFNDYKKKALEGSVPATPAAESSAKAGPSPSNTRNECSTKPAAKDDDDARAQKQLSPVSLDEPSSKIRQSGEESDADKAPTNRKSAPVVPELLSPTLPPATRSPRLPPLLSPTLPSELEEQLLQFSDESVKDTSPTTGKTTPIPSKSDSSATKSKSKQTDQQQGDVSSSTKLKVPNAKGGIKKSPIPAPPAQLPIKKVAVDPLRNAISSTSTPKPAITTPAELKLLIKLKYGRRNAKRVEALLKIAKRRATAEKRPVRQKLQEDMSDQKDTPTPLASKTVSKQREPMSGTKRAQAADDISPQGPAAKRPKTAATTPADSSQIPMQIPKSTPPTCKNSGQKPKPQPAASNKEPKVSPKGASMRRTESGDSEIGAPARNSINTNEEKPVNGPSPALSTETQSAKLEWRAWRDEWKKYMDLGRELKYACNPQAERGKSVDNKLGTVMAIESVLCFALAFIADNKSNSIARQAVVSSNWCSLIPYWQAVTHRAAPYPHLHGLCSLLGAIIYEAIHVLDLDTLAAIALPGRPSTNSNEKDKVVATPGCDDPSSPPQTVTLTENSEVIRSLIDLRKRLPESHREANRLWLEGSRLLPDVVLAREYKDTWLRRSRNFEGRGKQVLKVGKYAGDFFLPLAKSGAMAPGTGTTGVIEAIRFGCVFLEDWCNKEGVKWASKLKL